MRAAIYARLDVEGPARLIEQQLSQCRLLLDVEEWEEVGAYVDRGYSGMSLARPELQRLLADAAAGMFDRVVAATAGRIARNLGDLQTFERDLDRLGVELVTVEPRHEVPTG